MTKTELRNYILSTTNLAPLSRVVKSRDPELYQDIIDSWNYSDPFINFVEATRQYMDPISIYCPYGHRMKFNGYHQDYTCKKSCKHSVDKRKSTMVERYGVDHALQSPEIKSKFNATLMDRYGTDNLYSAFADQRKSTNIERYGTETPLASKIIQQKAAATLFDNTGYKTNFHRINDTPELQKKAYYNNMESRKEKNPAMYDYDHIISVLENNSYAKASSMLDMYQPYLRSVVERVGRTDLLPKKSYYETLIGKFLDTLGIAYVTNTRSIITPYELDFYIPDHNLAIEFNGLSWHSEVSGKKDSTYHLNKTLMCNRLGISLVHIFQDEWDDYEESIKSILKTKMGIKKTTLYARNLSLVETSAVDTRGFLDTYHLQGFCSATKYYVATLDDTIVAAMTFRRKHGNTYELSRYCIHPDYSIVGIAQRLFKCFTSSTKYDIIFTYSDRRYFDGRIYDALGFEYDGETKPNYWYIGNEIVGKKHRLNFTKKKLIQDGHDSLQTEWDIMKSMNYDRIWDCGSTKWKIER